MTAYGSTANPVRLNPFSRIVEVHWGSGRQLSVLATVLSASAPVDDMRWELLGLNGAPPFIQMAGWGHVIGVPAPGLVEEQPLRTETPPGNHQTVKGTQTDFKFSFRTFNGISSAKFKMRLWANKVGYLAGSPSTTPRVYPTPPPPPPPSALLVESDEFTLTSNQADLDVWQRRWLRIGSEMIGSPPTPRPTILVQSTAF